MMHQICRVLDATLKKPEYQGLKVVFYVSKEPNDVTNGIFLLGAFLCAFLGAAPEEACGPSRALTGASVCRTGTPPGCEARTICTSRIAGPVSCELSSTACTALWSLNTRRY